MRAWLDRLQGQPKTLERCRQLVGYVLNSELAEKSIAELKARLLRWRESIRNRACHADPFVDLQ